LQRVQLKIGSMVKCENISITTVNSLCTEAVFHKQDCSVSLKVLNKSIYKEALGKIMAFKVYEFMSMYIKIALKICKAAIRKPFYQKI
jgi:hypothetical protein